MTTKKSEKEFGMAHAIAEMLTTRFLVEDPIKGWRVFSAKRVFAAQQGKLLLPEFASRIVRVAHADVAVKNGRLVALYRVRLSEWRLDAEGRVDQDALMSRILEKLDWSEDTQHSRTVGTSCSPSKADIDAICLVLRLPRAN